MKERLRPGEFMEFFGYTSNRERFGEIFLPNEFLEIKLPEIIFEESADNPENTFKYEFLQSTMPSNKSFMKPAYGRWSISNIDKAKILASKIDSKIIRGIVKYNANKADSFSIEDFSEYCPVSSECKEDLSRTKNNAEKIMVLLLFAIFQNFYGCIHGKIYSYFVNPVKNSLRHGIEHDVRLSWRDPLFLEVDEKKKKRSLKDVYVNPCFSNGNKVVSVHDNLKRKDDLLNQLMDVISDADDRQRLAVVLGGPGMGKSTLFAKILNHKEIEVDSESKEYLIDGKSIRLYRFSDMNASIQWKQQNDNGEIVDTPSELILNQMVSYMSDIDNGIKAINGTVLLLDGFDECSASLRQRIDILNSMHDHWRHNTRIIITCRSYYLPDTSGLKKNVSLFTIQPFDKIQMEQFTKAYFCDLGNISEYVERMLDRKKDTYFVNDGIINEPEFIFGIPIILYLIEASNIEVNRDISLKLIYDTLFFNGNGIYDKMIHNLSYESDKSKAKFSQLRLPEERIPEYKEFLNTLSKEIAYYMFRTGECQNADMDNLLQEMERRNVGFYIEGRKVDIYTALSSGTLVHVDTPYESVRMKNKQGKKIRFVHKSMYEYFMAKNIYELVIQNKDKASKESLVILLCEGKLTVEILQFLSDDMKEFIYSDFEEGIAQLLNNGIERCFLAPASIEERHILREKTKQAFENILILVQWFRNIKKIKLLFANNDKIRECFPDYLKLGHYIGANETAFDLQNINISGMDLSYVDLSGYDMKNAVAKECIFRYCNFAFTQLQGVDFSNSLLTGANFTGTSPNAKVIFEQHVVPWTQIKGYSPEVFNQYEVLTENLKKNGWYDKEGSYLLLGEYLGIPLKWRILEVKCNRALLIMDNIIEKKKYNDTFNVTNWKNSTIRKWLNDAFYNAAFSKIEKNIICLTAVEPHQNICEAYICDQGPATFDYVFLLSGQEVIKYYASKSISQKFGFYDIGGNQAAANYMQQKNGNRSGWWWLRNTSGSGDYAMNVLEDGNIYARGYNVNHPKSGVRAALWVDLSKLMM